MTTNSRVVRWIPRSAYRIGEKDVNTLAKTLAAMAAGAARKERLAASLVVPIDNVPTPDCCDLIGPILTDRIQAYDRLVRGSRSSYDNETPRSTPIP